MIGMAWPRRLSYIAQPINCPKAAHGMTPSSAGWPPSHWAAVTPDGPSLNRLEGTHTVDAVVIGAGFTGLSAALHLRAAGLSVIVVDAAEPGWGASGRNNGQVIPTLSRNDPDDIVARHGDAGVRFVAMLRDSASLLFDTVRREGLAAEAEQTGWVQPVHSEGRMKIAERRVTQWTRHGAQVELLDKTLMARKLGTNAWHGGWWNRTGGHINPLALTRELARLVIERGASIYKHTPVEAINRIRGLWVVTMPLARIAARAVVVATNAHTKEFAPQLVPDIAREVIPVRSWQMATAPLSLTELATVLPERSAVSDTHGELYFMRLDARQRLITGGALVNGTNGAERLKPYIAARLAHLFPAIKAVTFDSVWNGYVGITQDFMPRFHQIGPDGYAWVGCNGRAVSLSLAIGQEFARAITGTPRRDLALPFTEPEPIRFYPLVRRLAPLALLRYRWRDAREV
jgi:glycine/D-amino acid oxidase-like deaminating enzyme